MAPNQQPPNGSGTFMSVREAVMEIREDVKKLQATVAGQVSANTTARIDHESRLRSLERWRYGIPISGLVALGSIIAALVAGH